MKSKPLLTRIIAAGAWLFIVLLPGCGTLSGRMWLKYGSSIEPRPSKKVTISVPEFADARTVEDKGVLGKVCSAFTCQSYFTKDNVPHWVTDAVKVDLKNSGYDVVDGQPSEFTLEGKILEVFRTGYRSSVILQVVLKKESSPLFDKRYQKDNFNMLLGSGGLRNALKEDIHSLIADIDNMTTAH
jgi:hypothetical protein